ncbi:MAG: AbrB/MazE/SpoVT family DNA-binding domain-containing protein [Chloroflexia bacterium]
MEATVVKISSKYQVVLPKSVREALALRVGDEVIFIVDGNKVLLRPRPASFTEAMRGLHREVWAGQDVDEWLEEERTTWAE